VHLGIHEEDYSDDGDEEPSHIFLDEDIHVNHNNRRVQQGSPVVKAMDTRDSPGGQRGEVLQAMHHMEKEFLWRGGGRREDGGRQSREGTSWRLI
jgi:hypothetical protein